MKKIAVKDANIFIDLEAMGILDLWFHLNYETITSSFIADELAAGGHFQSLAYIDSGKIQSVNLSLIDVFELYESLEESGLSIGDISVLHLAMSRDALLLTGDGRLRTECEVHFIEYHGSLWILEQLVEKGILAPLVASQKLEHLLKLSGQQRRFLPEKLCKEMMMKWNK